jgi:SNF2 family DNA or RNA helicase
VLYDQVESTFLAELSGRTILAQNAAAAGTKCRQIANGAVYDEDHETHFIHDTKMDALEDYVEELSGQPCLVFYEYVHDMERIMAKFPKAKRIGSGISDKAMTEAVNEFNAGTLPMLVAHPASAGHGLNLQGAAAHVCWFGLTWDLELYDQAISRVHRQGNPNKHVFVHHIIASDTLDVRVLKVLAGKDRTQKALMKALISE